MENETMLTTKGISISHLFSYGTVQETIALFLDFRLSYANCLLTVASYFRCQTAVLGN